MPASISGGGDDSLQWVAGIDTSKLLKDAKEVGNIMGGVSDVTVQGIAKEIAAREIQLAKIQELKKQLATLSQQRTTEVNPVKIASLDEDIALVTRQLERLGAVGKEAFTAQEQQAQKVAARFLQLREAAMGYQAALKNPSEAGNVDKITQKLAEVNREMAKLAQAPGFGKLNQEIKDQVEDIGVLQARLDKLNATKSKATPEQLPRVDKEILNVSQELERINNSGKAAFAAVNQEARKTITVMDDLQAELGKLEKDLASATNPKQIAQFTQKIKEVNTSIAKLAGGGAVGDGLSKPIKEQIGAIERLQKKLAELKTTQVTAPAIQLPSINKEIEAISKELDRLRKTGKSTFDEQIGLMAKSSIQAKELREALNNATSRQEIAEYNKELQRVEKELQRLQNAGKKGFGIDGRPLKEQEGIIQRLERQVRLYQKGIQEATNTDNITKYNAKLRETQAELTRVQQGMKNGFDAAGNPLKEQLGILQRLERAAQLYRAAISTATNPELISKYNRKLQETEEAMKRTTNIGRQGFDAMGNQINRTSGMMGGLMNSLKGLAASFGVFLGVQELVQFGKELFEIAKKAEGVSQAFARIGSAADLENLRKQTRGTVSDLELMQAAVKADNFKIPMDVLGKGLAFAQKRARETGVEVDYLVNSFVDGIGRKSALKIDNLGISLVELQNEIKKTGDFATAVGNIMERDMQKSGVAVDYLADKSGRLSATWKNMKASIAAGLLAAFNPGAADTDKITQLTDKLKTSLGDFTNVAAKDQSRIIDEQIKKVGELSNKYKEIQDKVKNFSSFGTRSLRSLNDEKRAAGEQLAANQNLLLVMQKQSNAAETRRRIASDMLSITEMQGKVENLRKEAEERIITGQDDRDFVKKKLEEAETLQKKIDDLLGKSNDKQAKAANKRAEAEERAMERIREMRRKLQEDIDAIDSEYNRKSLSKDDEELANLRAKFTKVKSEVLQFNRENPKMQIGIEYMGKLDQAQAKAEADLLYRQQTERLKISLAESKELVEEYERVREEISAEYADKRYGAEVAKAKEAARKAQEELNKLSAIEPKDLTGGQLERKNFLSKNQKDEQKAEEQRYEKLLASLQSFEQKRINLIEQYQRDREALLLAGNLAEVEAIDKRIKESLGEMDNEAASKLKDIEALFNGVEDLSIKSAKQVVELAEAKLAELVKEGKITKTFAAEIKRLLKDTTSSIDSRIPAAMQNFAGALASVANEVSNVDKNFGAMLGTVANVVGGVGNIKKSILDIKAAQESFKTGGGLESILGMAGGIAGGIGAAIGVVTTVVGFINKAAEERERRREAAQQYSEELRIKAIEAQTAAMARQLEVIKDIYGTERLTEYKRSLEDITIAYDKQAGQLAKKYVLTGTKALDEMIALLNNGQQLTFVQQRYFDFEKQKGTVKTLESITNGLKDIKKNSASLEELQSLLDKGLLDDTTAAAVRNIISLGDAYKSTFNALREELTGNSLSSMVNELSELLRSGLDPSAKEFGDSFTEIIRKSIQKGFERSFIEKQMQKFYDLFAELSEDGLTKDEIERLRIERQKMVDAAFKGLKDLQEITGVDLTSKSQDDKAKGLSGAYRALGQETGDLIAGQFMGLRIDVNGIKGIMMKGQTQSTAFWQEMTVIAMDQYREQQKIEYNTRLTREELVLHTRLLQSLPPILTSIDNGVRANEAAIKANGG